MACGVFSYTIRHIEEVYGTSNLHYTHQTMFHGIRLKIAVTHACIGETKVHGVLDLVFNQCLVALQYLHDM